MLPADVVALNEFSGSCVRVKAGRVLGLSHTDLLSDQIVVQPDPPSRFYHAELADDLTGN